MARSSNFKIQTNPSIQSDSVARRLRWPTAYLNVAYGQHPSAVLQLGIGIDNSFGQRPPRRIGCATLKPRRNAALGALEPFGESESTAKETPLRQDAPAT